MIKKTLYFGNPTYLSMRNRQLVVKLPEVEKNDTLPEKFKKDSEVTFPIEDLGVIVLDHNQIRLSQRLIEMLLEKTKKPRKPKDNNWNFFKNKKSRPKSGFLFEILHFPKS